MSEALGKADGAPGAGLPDQAGAGGAVSPRRTGRMPRPVRLLAYGLDLIARREYLLVALMVVSMTLSAFSVYQATRAGDAADDRLGTLRIAEGDAARQSGYLQTVIAHDLNVLSLYCDAESGRRDEMSGMLAQTHDSAMLAANIIMTRSIKPLVLGDRLAQCASAESPSGSDAVAYDVDRARQTLESSQSLRRNAVPSSGQVDAELTRHGVAEEALMTAGLLYALVLALLIAVDLLSQRNDRPPVFGKGPPRGWRRGLLVTAGLAAIAATVLAATYTLVLPVDETNRFITIGFLVLLTAVIIVAARWRWIPRPPEERAGRPHWWAEVMGAAAIVAFSLAAVGLSMVNALERDASMRADVLQASAQQLQQAGEQFALRDLAAVAASAQFAAQEAAAASLGLGDPARRSEALRELDERKDRHIHQVNSIDRTAREQIIASLAPACSGEPVTHVGMNKDPFTLHQEFADEAANIVWHVRQYQEAALACDTESAIARAEARAWARHASWFTVALVVLGLAGFMLSLAADPRREARVSRILRGVGVLGIGAGLALGAVAIPDLVWRADLPDQADVPDIAAAVAAVRINECRPDAIAIMDDAIKQFDGFGPAFEARARAALCAGSHGDWWRLSSDVDSEDVQAAIADLNMARQLGVSGTSIDFQSGWLALLDGIKRSDEDAVRKGLWLTELVIADMERTYPAEEGALAPGMILHLARFNRALALGALPGEEKKALAAYREAMICLSADSECDGGGLLDDALIDEAVLWALADIELLAGRAPEGDATRDRYRLANRVPQGDATLDRYRLALVDDPSTTRRDVALAGERLEVFLQSIQVQAEAMPARTTIIWYGKWRPGDTWELLQIPSGATMHPGGYLLDRSIALGECAPQPYYRADVYAGGKRISIEPDNVISPPAAGIRVASARLGLSSIVPAWWATEPDPGQVAWCDLWNPHDGVDASLTSKASDNGLDWHVGPNATSGLSLRRVEGVVPGDDVDAYLMGALAAWAHEVRGVDAFSLTPVPGRYFLGSSDSLLLEDGDRHLGFAAAYEPYSWEAPERGGTVFFAALDGVVDGEGADRVELDWIEEVVLETPQLAFPTTTVADDGITIAISDAWEVDLEPGPAVEPPWNLALSAQPPNGSPDLNVYQRLDDAGSVQAAVSDSIERLARSNRGSVPAELESRRQVSVPGALAAELVEYTWYEDGSRWSGWDLWVSDGVTLTQFTVVDHESDRWNIQSTIEAMLNSVSLTP